MNFAQHTTSKRPAVTHEPQPHLRRDILGITHAATSLSRTIFVVCEVVACRCGAGILLEPVHPFQPPGVGSPSMPIGLFFYFVCRADLPWTNQS